MHDAPISVMIAEDEPDLRCLLVDLLSRERGWSVVGAAADTFEAIDLGLRHQPDAAIIDVKMPGGGGIRAVRELRRRSPRTAVVALSAFDQPELVLPMLEAGAHRYLVKPASRKELTTAIRGAVEAKVEEEPSRPVLRLVGQ